MLAYKNMEMHEILGKICMLKATKTCCSLHPAVNKCTVKYVVTGRVESDYPERELHNQAEHMPHQKNIHFLINKGINNSH